MPRELHKFKDKLEYYKGQKFEALSANQQKEVDRLCKKFITLVNLLETMQDQLMDARNIDYHNRGNLSLYPDAFEWKDKTPNQSKDSMETRKEELGRQFDTYVSLPVIGVIYEPQD